MDSNCFFTEREINFSIGEKWHEFMYRIKDWPWVKLENKYFTDFACFAKFVMTIFKHSSQTFYGKETYRNCSKYSDLQEYLLWENCLCEEGSVKLQMLVDWCAFQTLRIDLSIIVD